MSKQLEHDYIGPTSSMENPENFLLLSNNRNSNLKTELSLSLPGSESPERKPGFTIFGKGFEGKTQNLTVKGAKRGFSDAIDGCEKWGLSMNGGSECNLSKDDILYSPRTGLVDTITKNGQSLKEGADVISSTKSSSVQEKQLPLDSGSAAPAAKAQVVGWPPIRSFRKNTMASASASASARNNGNTEEKPVSACLYVKVSLDGAPYLRKVDLQFYKNYMELSSALEKMFSCFITGQYKSHGNGKHERSEGHTTDHLRASEYVLTYEDKDGDWMLVGDVPWKMFTENCKKLRIMKGSEAIGLAPNAAEKCKTEA